MPIIKQADQVQCPTLECRPADFNSCGIGGKQEFECQTQINQTSSQSVSQNTPVQTVTIRSGGSSDLFIVIAFLVLGIFGMHLSIFKSE